MSTPPIARQKNSVQIIQTSGLRYIPPSNFYEPPKPTITGVNNPATSFWTAGQPLLPIAPRETTPRQMQFLSEQNKIYTPRANEFLTFEDLRRLASYPLASMMITLYANAIAAREFRIRLRQIPGLNNKAREQKEKSDPIIPKLTNFLMNPNPDNTWREFIYMLMTEVQTTDAPAIFIRRNKVRDIGELRLMDGTMIARYIDDNGWTPTSESPAYAQLWWGTPAWDLTRDQLLYRPKCPRVYKLLGNSPTERVSRLLELGFARLELKLQWAENGTIPDGLMVVPPDAPPDLVERQQAWMNSVMSGNQQRRVQLRLIQGFAKDGKDQILFPKEKMLMDPYDEMEIRQLAVAYDVPKQRFMEQMNRASAETAQESAEEEGYGPGWQYIRDLMNILIQTPVYFNLPQYEFSYADEREHDIVKQATADQIYVQTGVKAVNEVRDGLGLDAFAANANGPDADLMDGPITINGNPVQNAYASQTQAVESHANSLLPSGDEPTATDDEGRSTRGSVQPPQGKVRKSSRLAGRLVLDAEEITEFNKNILLAVASNARKNQQFEKVHPGASINPHHFSLQSETARNKIAKVVEDHFGKVVKKVIAKIRAVKVRKADEDDIRKLLGDDDFWQSLWITLPGEISDSLEEAVKSGMSQGMLQVDVNVSSSDVINKLNAIARDEARARSAEMVGMKWVDDELVPNPKAQYVISDTTRDELRNIVSGAFEDNTPMADLISDIQEAGAFSTVRAQLIAHTEVARAQAGGTYQTWKQTGVVKTYRWQHSNLEGVCEDCTENAEAGEIDFGKEFPSGVKYPPEHPRCRCVVYAVKTGK